jgi:hypothetical protein
MDQAIIQGNAEQSARLRDLVTRLTNDELGRTIEGDWTVSVALAHIAFWDRRALILLDRWERDGIQHLAADADVINDAMVPQWKALPPRVAADDAVAAAEAVDQMVASISDKLAQEIRSHANGVRLDRAKHRREHLDQIERLLAG